MFKKWFKKHKPYEIYSCMDMAPKTWKAALECVRDKMLPNCYEPMDIYDFIEEELNE